MIKQRIEAEVDDILANYGAATAYSIDRAADDLQSSLATYGHGRLFGGLVIEALRVRANFRRIRAL
jgi:hypothetical protein